MRLGLLGGIAAVGLGYFAYIENYNKQQLLLEQEENLWKNTQTYAIGRDDWTLVDCRTNKVITKDDLNGKWILMYFGFAHCPDICPETMEKVMDIFDIHAAEMKKNNDQKEILPVFITIDPERDTPEALAYYLEDYPHFLGLTGSSKQIKEVCKNYKIYFRYTYLSDHWKMPAHQINNC